jgi:hypothetical protein
MIESLAAKPSLPRSRVRSTRCCYDCLPDADYLFCEAGSRTLEENPPGNVRLDVTVSLISEASIGLL